MTIQCKNNTVYDGKGQFIEDVDAAFKIKAGVSNVTIKNYKFRNVTYGVLGQKDGDAESRNIVVEGCEMHNDPGSDPYVDKEGQNSGVNGTDTGAGILVYGNSVFHDTRVISNNCTGLARILMTGEEARAWHISGNRSNGSEDTSIYVKGCCSIIEWNSIIDSGKCGIKVRNNKDKTAPVGGHLIRVNYVENFSMIKPDGGGCFNIAVPAIVQYNIGVLNKWPAGKKDPSSSARCFAYSGNNIVSRNNKATTYDNSKYYGFKIDIKAENCNVRDDQTVFLSE